MIISSQIRPVDSKTSVKQHPATTTSTKPANPYNGPLGASVSRKQFIGPVKPKMISEPPSVKKEKVTPSAKHSNLPAAVPLPDQRTKLQFTIRRPGVNMSTATTTGSKLVKPSVPNATVTKSSEDKQQSTSASLPSAVSKPVVTSATVKTLTPSAKTLTTSDKTIGTSTKTTTSSKAKLQGLVKPKATPAKTGFMGLVPYSAEDSNSSSDSENYDAVAEQLSKLPADTSKSVSKSKTVSGKDGSTPSKVVDVEKTTTTNSASNLSDMKPPSQTISHAEIVNGAQKKQRTLANGTDLTVLRKPDSPLKLTITTNGNAQRLKATGHWRVSDMESQVSPSPASDSSMHSNHSNVSTNSTSEWAVREKNEAPSTPVKIKEEAAVYGWNITPGKLELMRSFSDPGLISKNGAKLGKQEVKLSKNTDDMERTTSWLIDKHSSDKVETQALFGYTTAKQTKVDIIDSSVPRTLSFEKEETDIKKSSKESSRTSSPSRSIKVQKNSMKDTEKENVHVSQKKKKHKKNKRDLELYEEEEDAEEMYEEKSMRAVSDKAKSPDAEEGDSGYYSIKSKNLGSDLDDEEEEEDREQKPKKHKKKKRKRRSDDDDDASQQDTQPEEYGPALPDTIKKRIAGQEERSRISTDYKARSPDSKHKHRSHEQHRYSSPDYKHKSDVEQRLKSPEHGQPRHKSDDNHHFRSPDRDSHKSSSKYSHGNDHKNRHRSSDRDGHHRVRSPDFERRLKSPDHRVRSPDYEHQHKKHRSGDSENAKHRTSHGSGASDRHIYSSEESDRHYSVNRTSDDEDHSYAKRVKEKKRKRNNRERDEYSDHGDELRSHKDNTHKGDHRKNRDDVLDRLESPTSKKHKSSVNGGDAWGDDSSTASSKSYGDDRRKSEGKSRYDGEFGQIVHS